MADASGEERSIKVSKGGFDTEVAAIGWVLEMVEREHLVRPTIQVEAVSSMGMNETVWVESYSASVWGEVPWLRST